MTTTIRSIRERLNKKAIALLIIFVVALTGTGLASLATLQQQLNVTVVGTATTIDFRANGQTPTLAIDFSLVERGDIRFVALNLTNSGTGYVSISTSPSSPGGGTNPLATINAADITVNTKMVAYADIAATNCSVAGGVVPTNWSTVPTIANVPIFGGAGFTIAAGGFKDICLVMQVGGDVSLGPVASGGTNFDALWTLRGFYP